MTYIDIQKIAKDTIEYAKNNIFSGMKLKDIKELCEHKLIELGADSFWYYNIGAFVFAGNETSISISGKNYSVSEKIIADEDIITIDLSPQCNNIWGDYARTLVVQNGHTVETKDINNIEWKNGILSEKILHKKMCNYVTPNMTFEELYFYINELIEKLGYINLDFMGNLGHSIVKKKEDRIYIEKGNKVRLGDVAFFTFEPHISLPNSNYGFKREDIYYFKNDRLEKL